MKIGESACPGCDRSAIAEYVARHALAVILILVVPVVVPLMSKNGICAEGTNRGNRTEEGWSQFRGPNGQGISESARPPVTFGPGTNIAWTVDCPKGQSSPCLRGGKVFLTALNDGKLLVLGFDQTSGRQLWRREVSAEKIEYTHEFGGPAAPTPAANDSLVVAYFGSYGVVAFKHDGTQVWSKPLTPPKNHYGTASSPVVQGDKALILADSDDKQSKLIALRLEDGSVAWSTDRPMAAANWSTPALWRPEGQPEQLVVLGSRRVVSYDPATGREQWWCDGFPVETISVPIVGTNMLWICSSSLGGLPDETYEVMPWARVVEMDRNGDGMVQKSEVPQGQKVVLRPELPKDNPGYAFPRSFRDMFDGFDGNRDGTLTEAEWDTYFKNYRARAVPALKAIKPGGSGDITRTHLAWEMRRGIPEIPSPVRYRGVIYLVRDGGFLEAVRETDGSVIFNDRLGVAGGYCASPVAADGRLYIASHSGSIVVVDAGAAQSLD